MPTPTWDRLRPDRRARILDAAQTEFGAHGFSGASLNTIARQAGVAKGSLFQYFQDKSDFFAHLSNMAAERIRTAMEGAIAELDWEHDFFGSLVEVMVAWDAYFSTHPDDLAMTAAVNLEPDSRARVAVRQAVNVHYLAALTPLLERGRSAGQLREDADSEVFVAMLLLVLPHLALAPQVPGLDPVLGLDRRDQDSRRAVFEGLVDMFRRAFGA